ncbi:MAG: ketoacyl-ACP synthase III [Bacteroidetes bacterium]|nr:MAG: ketoacyl-ACP synthase III [Bacteroidota bacterium]
MSSSIYSIITGTGSYIPTKVVKNEDFWNSEFYDSKGNKMEKDPKEITAKFEEITTIAERRYVTDDLVTSDIAFFAAQKAIESAGIDPEELDHIIVAHNFGDVAADNMRSDMVPSIASRVKHKLGIKSPYAVCYDVPFGCPGWVEALIQADYYIKAGDDKKVLVIGADTLSRIYDPHDIDSMIYADGAGAVILEAKESDTPIGILAHQTRSDTELHSKMLVMSKSYHPELAKTDKIFMKMNGRRLYQYALENVPMSISKALKKANVELSEVKKLLIHQANGKMDDAMCERLYKIYDLPQPENIMPMTVQWLGNSSVATVPTLLDLIMKGKMEPHKIESGDIIIFTSVGAGMNINAVIYKSV